MENMLENLEKTNRKEINSFVSVIIPCLNEEQFIARCLDSIIANDYPKDLLEILIVDGISKDRTRKIVESYIKQFPFIRILENPKLVTPTALNIGIQNAKGSVIIIMGAHNIYNSDYISKCAKYLYEYNVDIVGGIMKTVPGSDSYTNKGIVFALSHSFGVGNSYFRVGVKEPMLVDTVPFGCYKKEVFEKVGLFNENLIRNQDIDLSLRLKRMGGKILLVPDIISSYYARSNLKDLFKQNFMNGFWVIYSAKFTKRAFSLRHLIPFAFLLSFFGSFCLSFLWMPFLYLFILITGSYIFTNILISMKIAMENGIKLFPFVVASFVALHFSYGLGSIWGLLNLIKKDN